MKIDTTPIAKQHCIARVRLRKASQPTKSTVFAQCPIDLVPMLAIRKGRSTKGRCTACSQYPLHPIITHLVGTINLTAKAQI
jgi:hypothetical protein